MHLTLILLWVIKEHDAIMKEIERANTLAEDKPEEFIPNSCLADGIYDLNLCVNGNIEFYKI